MSFATAHTIALQGALGHLIEVQVDVSPGMVTTTMVGRPDAALSEARDRVRMAIANSSPRWPATKRVTILLSPADLPKRGTHFDLAIAVAVKAADNQVPPEPLRDTVFIGELTLSGGLRPVAGMLPMVLAAAERGIRRVFVPEPQAREAAMVPGMSVLGVRSLAQVVAELRGEEVPEAPPVAATSYTRLVRWRGQDHLDDVDLSDLKGMEEPKYAAEVAAAGGHHLLFSGPKGCGKTSLAERIPGMLPDLDQEAALELTAIHSLAAGLGEHAELVVRPPYFAPHHDASTASLLGGGTGRVRPGEVSKAHHGVLFLDEFPLFRADVVQALRQPMEGGEVTIARGEESATFPARAMVVLAANPCPCGNYHGDVGGDACECREQERRDYRRKLEGPLMDRVDITCHVRGAAQQEMHDRFAVCEATAVVRERVRAARAVQHARYTGRGWRLNGQVPSSALLDSWPLADAPRDVIDQAVYGGKLSRRGATRVHRLAWTVADLAGHAAPTVVDVQVALALRLGDPLPARVLERVG